jgi:hypothetical protein
MAVFQLFSWWLVTLPEPWRIAGFVAVGLLGLPLLVLGTVDGRRVTRTELGLSGKGSLVHALVLLPPTLAIVAVSFALKDNPGAYWDDFFNRSLTYPIWAFLQNLFVLAFVGLRIRVFVKNEVAAAVTIALFFGLLHVPNLPLTIATTVLGLAFAGLFRWRATLIVIAICHGVLGATAGKVWRWSLRVGALTADQHTPN